MSAARAGLELMAVSAITFVWATSEVEIPGALPSSARTSFHHRGARGELQVRLHVRRGHRLVRAAQVDALARRLHEQLGGGRVLLRLP